MNKSIKYKQQQQPKAKISFEDVRIKPKEKSPEIEMKSQFELRPNSDLQTKPEKLSQSPIFIHEEPDKRPITYTDDDVELKKRIAQLINSEPSDDGNNDYENEPEHVELTYEQIMNKYKNLKDDADDLIYHHRKQSSTDFIEKEQLEKSIKLSQAQIDQYKSQMEKVVKENESNTYFRRSIESERLRLSLSHNDATEFDIYLDNLKEKIMNPEGTLEYSITSRRESEFRPPMDTEHDQSYISHDEIAIKGDNSSRQNSRYVDSDNKESVKFNSKDLKSPIKTPLEARKRSPSPTVQLKSPATNAHLVYDKFVKEDSSQKQAQKSSSSKEDVTSPIRHTNLSKNELSELPVVNEANISKEITPSREIRAQRSDNYRSPLRIEELEKRAERLQNSGGSYKNKQSSAKKSFHATPDKARPAPTYDYDRGSRYIRPPTPDDNHIYESPKISSKHDDEFLPKFDDFQALLQSAKEVNNSNLRNEREESPEQNINPRRYDLEYQSIQDTLKSIKEMRKSEEKMHRSIAFRQSHMETEFDYSLTSENFSRADEVIEDATEVLASIEKIPGYETISALTNKSPDRETLRDSWKRSSIDAYKFIVFKDKSILELMPYYDKAKLMMNKSPEVQQILDRIQENLKLLTTVTNI